MADNERGTKVDHRYYDELFTKSRRMLWNDPEWRQGPERAYEVSSQAINIFKQYETDFDKPYMEIGCGPYSPLGVSAVMYLNGVENAFAFDTRDSDHERTAEALYDLLVACALEPRRWNIQNQNLEKFFGRLYSFDVVALRRGNLSGGIANTRLRCLIGNLECIPLADETVSLVSSRATLEHILDFHKGMQELYRIMRPGGVSFHSIDLADHRIYRKPDQYNMWSFLTEAENWSDGLCNRLRAHEILTIAKSVGFNVDVVGVERNEIPRDTLNNLSGPYAGMNSEELMITSLTCVFRR